MEQYIPKSALVAEIERRKSELQSRIAELGTFESNTLGLFQDVDLYNDILSFINTLEVKEVLTWQDIRLISDIGEDFMNSKESDNLSEEEYYTEILNKFKAQKEK